MKKALRLTLGIGILVTLAVFIAGLFIGIHWVRTRTATLETAARTTVDTTARGLDNMLIQAELAARFAASGLGTYPRTAAEMTVFTRFFYDNIAKTCPAVSHVCVGFAPGMLTSNAKEHVFIVRRVGEDNRIESLHWTDGDGFDYHNQAWYLLPAALGRDTWTIAHRSNIVKGRLILSYVVPFFRQVDGQQRLIGVTDVAIDVISLNKLLVPFHPTAFATHLSRAETFVVNPWGTHILAPDSQEKIGLSLFDSCALFPVHGDRDSIRHLLRMGPVAGTVRLQSTALLGEPAAAELFYRRLCNGCVALIALPAAWRLQLITPAAIIGALVLLLFVGLVALAFLAERSRLAAESAAAEGELNAARAIQHDLLPAVLPPLDGYTNVTVAATLDPARGVGGDLFDVVPVDDTHIAFIIGDVSGKGVPASLFMAIVQTLQRSLLHQIGEDPSSAVTSLNRLLSANNRSNMFVTYWIGILNVTTGELVFTNGGHNPPLLHRASGEIETLRDRHGTPLGILFSTKKPYRSSRLTLNAGDTLVLYTDGVTEAMDRHGHMFTEKRLRSVLVNRPAEAPTATLAAIKSVVADFVGGAEPFDDITVLVARYVAAEKQKGA